MSEEEIFLEQLLIFEKEENAKTFFSFSERVLKDFNLSFSDSRLKLSVSESGRLSLSVIIGNRTVLSIKRTKKGLHLMLLLPDTSEQEYTKHAYFLEISGKLKGGKKHTDALLISFDCYKFYCDEQTKIINLWLTQISQELQKNVKAKRDIHNRYFYEAITNLPYRESILEKIDFIQNTKKNLSRQIENEEEGDGSDYDFDPKDVLIANEQRSLDSIISRIKYESINLNPDFQRSVDLWQKKTMSRLVESILLRLPLPAFYFDASDDDEWLVVDGLQRLTVLQKFVVFADKQHPEYKKRLKLGDLQVLKEYNKLSYDELPSNMKRRIKEFQVTTYLIQPGTPEEVKYSIFHRINTGGIKLNPQEIRNALNQKINTPQFLKKLSDLELFRNVVNISAKRMRDREIALRFLAFQELNAEKYTGSISIFLDKAMKEIGNKSEEDLKSLENKYVQALSLCDELFEEHSFSKSLAKGKIQFNTALYEVWTYYLANIPSGEIEKVKRLKENIISGFKALLLNSAFDDSISIAFTDTTRVMSRFEMIYDLLNNLGLTVLPWKKKQNA